MKCPKCQFENEEGSKFCLECGEKLEIKCLQCGKILPPLAKFCNQCGQKLEEVAEEKQIPETEGERKHVTVLFSDLSGYTSMSEKLDPEEVKEITSQIFGEISQVIRKYEGFVEKFVGDAVMALFGVPKAHEDDPVRAIRVATEINELVDAISPEVEKKIGQPIGMHTGVNTGLVVTGEVDIEKGTHGVTGDTINIASRLSSLAKKGEILVGSDTFRRAEGHFSFETLEPTTVKGKAEPVWVYKVLSKKEIPTKIHRLSGLKADLIGRKVEIAQLEEAVGKLRKGKGGIFSICGDAGTGKSRLVEEFKAALDPEEIQWLEGHAYAYSQNIPYFPLIDLLNRAFRIKEGDPPEKVREKIESEIEDLVGRKVDVVPYVGGLFSIKYPEVEKNSPEFWKTRLQDAIQTILSALAGKAPTIFCLEDLHWADPSSVELLRDALLQIRQPAIVLCVYRPTFSLFASHQLSAIAKIYKEIRLQDLSPSEAQDMLQSLLKTDAIPAVLRQFVQDKAEGNPFYLEEMLNSLIESETLVRDNGRWRIEKSISESDISSTIHGVISGRLDRLENETKRILQEASVIGRAFLYEILRKITELRDHIDKCLSGLERLDLIRTRSLQPDLEYVFKHALTQQVVYNGLLKKERQVIHERIGLVMEQLFKNRLPEFYETLAFHFKQGQSVFKAVDYLMKSGEKSLKRYALEESHQYYKEAFELLSNKSKKTKEENRLLIDILIQWCFTFHHRGYFKELNELLNCYVELAKSIDDEIKLGMFYAWMGYALHYVGRLRDGYQYLLDALKIGEKRDNNWLIGWSCAFLTWTCVDSGLLDEAIKFGEIASEINERFLGSDQDLYFVLTGGVGYAYWLKGNRKKTLETGKNLRDFGFKYSNSRCLSMGSFYVAASHLIAGDFNSAIEIAQKEVLSAKEPTYSQNLKLMIGIVHIYDSKFEEAENVLKEVMTYCKKSGFKTAETPAYALLGLVLIAKGQMNRGFKMLKEGEQSFLENGYKYAYATANYFLGKVYFQIFEGSGPISLSVMVKNLVFLLRSVPSASKKAESHFNKAIEVANQIGANGTLGITYLDLGLLHRAKGRLDQAKDCISKAIQVFEQCDAEVYLKQAREALTSFR